MTKKIVRNDLVNVLDENGRFVPSHQVPPEEPAEKPHLPDGRNVSLTDLLEKNLALLYQETRYLMEESRSQGKLSKDSAYAMRENMKLIMDLKKKERELLDALTVEELEQLAREESEKNAEKT